MRRTGVEGWVDEARGSRGGVGAGENVGTSVVSPRCSGGRGGITPSPRCNGGGGGIEERLAVVSLGDKIQSSSSGLLSSTMLE